MKKMYRGMSFLRKKPWSEVKDEVQLCFSVKLGKGDNLTTEVLLRICTDLNCDFANIILEIVN